MNKKGATEIQLLYLINLLLAAIVIALLLSYVHRSATVEGFKEKAIAIDSVLLLNTIYAAPNDISAIYLINDPRFYIEIENYNIRVNEKKIKLPGENYPYARNLYIKQEVQDLKEAQTIIIDKQDNQINIKKG